jgi:hypothetical protein
MKDKVYGNNPYTEDKLKGDNRYTVSYILKHKFQEVFKHLPQVKHA